MNLKIKIECKIKNKKQGEEKGAPRPEIAPIYTRSYLVCIIDRYKLLCGVRPGCLRKYSSNQSDVMIKIHSNGGEIDWNALI